MSNLIKVDCKNCRAMNIEPKEVLELIPAQGDNFASYTFRCPGCGEQQTKECDIMFFKLMKSEGVRETTPLSKEKIDEFAENIDDELKELKGDVEEPKENSEEELKDTEENPDENNDAEEEAEDPEENSDDEDDEEEEL